MITINTNNKGEMLMKKKAIILSLLVGLLIPTTAFASSGYMYQNMTLENDTSNSSAIGWNNSTTARVDVNTISDTGGYTKVKVFVLNTATGTPSTSYYMQAQNTKFFSVSQGNIKAVFKRYRGTHQQSTGTMNVGYSFVYDY